MLSLVVESHTGDISVPVVCGAERCGWISLEHQQTLQEALKHYEIYSKPLSMAVCQLRSKNFSFVPSNTLIYFVICLMTGS